MEQKNKKIILVSLSSLSVVILIIFIIAIIKMKSNNQPTPASTPTPKTEKTQETKDKSVTPLTKEKKAEIEAIKNITGKITAVDLKAIKVTTNEGKALTLKIPQEGASFEKQTTQTDGSFLMEEVGLLDLPTNKEVDIQYNSSTNEVMLVIIK